MPDATELIIILVLGAYGSILWTIIAHCDAMHRRIRDLEQTASRRSNG